MIAATEAMYVVPKRPVLRLIDGAADPATTGAQGLPLASELAETGLLEAELPQNFDDLFRRFAPYVGAIALKIMGRDDEVDDLVQEVFIKAHRGLPNLKDPGAVRPWLATITVRMARRRLRLYWFSRVFRLNDLGDNLVDSQASPEQKALVSSVYRWLERMPANERIVWVLRQVEGQTLEQIAELSGCSLSTVQRRLRAARSFMDKVLSRERVGKDD